jgi:hypothetical protein
VNPRYRKYLIPISILLHILLIFLWEAGIKLEIFGYKPAPQQKTAVEPIVFDLQPRRPPARPTEVIETPADARVTDKPKDADFLSDKNALARNAEPVTSGKIGDPYARGDLPSHDIQPPQAPPGGQPVQPGKQTTPGETKQTPDQMNKLPDLSLEKSAREIIKQFLQEQQKQAPAPPGGEENLPGALHDNRFSRALESGGLSFNTYDWDFAPYMLALKNRIRHNIYPPPAFTLLGLIKGVTLLRFRIYPDGRMKKLEILGYEGHKSLMQTSNTAIEISAPFPPLPENFPEPYLEVTCLFSYFVHDENRAPAGPGPGGPKPFGHSPGRYNKD